MLLTTDRALMQQKERILFFLEEVSHDDHLSNLLTPWITEIESVAQQAESGPADDPLQAQALGLSQLIGVMLDYVGA